MLIRAMKSTDKSFVLRIEKLCHVLNGGRELFDALTFSLRTSELAILCGPSGCGKTTLLRLISGLLSVQRGDIYIAGTHVNRVPVSERKVAYMLQEFPLYEHMNVFENIVLQRRTLKHLDCSKNVEKVLEQVGLENIDFYGSVQNLSGGERQRIAFCKALFKKSSVLLLDEPFSNLDTVIARRCFDLVKQEVARTGRSALLVAHERDFIHDNEATIIDMTMQHRGN